MSNMNVTVYIGVQKVFDSPQIAFIHLEDLTGRERLLIYDEINKGYMFAHKSRCLRALTCNWIPLKPGSYNLSGKDMETFMSSCLSLEHYELFYTARHNREISEWTEISSCSDGIMQVKDFNLTLLTPPAPSQPWDLGSHSFPEPVRRSGPVIKTIAEQDSILDELWADFGDVPMDPETEKIEEPFLHFPAGTHREAIWRWFDERYSKGVASLLRCGSVRARICFECETQDCVYNHEGECRYMLVHEKSPVITPENGCESGELPYPPN